MDQELERLEKEVRLAYNHGRRSYVSVVREHYLREDISCKSELCVLCPDIHRISKGACDFIVSGFDYSVSALLLYFLCTEMLMVINEYHQ